MSTMYHTRFLKWHIADVETNVPLNPVFQDTEEDAQEDAQEDAGDSDGEGRAVDVNGEAPQ